MNLKAPGGSHMPRLMQVTELDDGILYARYGNLLPARLAPAPHLEFQRCSNVRSI